MTQALYDTITITATSAGQVVEISQARGWAGRCIQFELLSGPHDGENRVGVSTEGGDSVSFRDYQGPMVDRFSSLHVRLPVSGATYVFGFSTGRVFRTQYKSPGLFAHGFKTVTTPGTSEALLATAVATGFVQITPLPGNAAYINLGFSSGDLRGSGVELLPTHPGVFWPVNLLSKMIYVDADNGGDGVSYALFPSL